MDELRVEKTSHFDVLILGPFVLYRDGVPLETSSWQRKVQTLFRILATSPDRRRSREELVDILWPQALAEAGSRNLRVVLHMLRKGLGGGEPPPVLSEWGWISLNPVHEWDLDLDRLEQRLGSAQTIAELETAAGHYRAEALPEERYEDWAAPVRARVQRTWRDLCLRLGKLHGQAGSYESAVAWLERALETDPLDEETVQDLLITLSDMGRRTEALRRYQHFTERLRQELDLSPSRETARLVASLKTEANGQGPPADSGASRHRGTPVIPRHPPPAEGVLVGRSDELSRTLRCLPTLHEAPRLIVIQGERGLGKTRFLSEIAHRAREAGLMTLGASCFKHQQNLAYGPIHDAMSDYIEAQPESVLQEQLASIGVDLIGAIPEIGIRLPMDKQGFAPDVDELRFAVALSTWISRIARERGLVILIDDMQYADDATTRLLHFLGRQSGLDRTLVVGSCRQDEFGDAHRLLEAVFDQSWALSISLAPLGRSELGQLLESWMKGRCSSDLIDAICAHTRGNPGLASRVLESLQGAGELARSDGVWHMDSGSQGLPLEPVSEPVLVPFRRLSPTAQEVVGLASIFGDSVLYEVLRLAWAGDELTLCEALEESVESGLLEDEDSIFRFRHPLGGPIVYRLLSSPRRSMFHRRVGAALDTLDSGEPTTLADEPLRVSEVDD